MTNEIWNKVLSNVVINAGNSDFESALYQLIHETYRLKNLTEKDKDIIVILIALHEAINGKHNLKVLTEFCLKFAK